MLLRLREPVVERIAGAANGADRILLAARVEQLAQPPDMHVHGALIDIDVAAPDAVEQLLAAEDAAGMLEEKFQQAIFGRAEVDGAAGTRDARLLLIERKLPEFADRDGPIETFMTDLEMLVMSPGGRERTETEFRTLFRDAGFNYVRTLPTASPSCIFEARPA